MKNNIYKKYMFLIIAFIVLFTNLSFSKEYFLKIKINFNPPEKHKDKHIKVIHIKLKEKKDKNVLQIKKPTSEKAKNNIENVHKVGTSTVKKHKNVVSNSTNFGYQKSQEQSEKILSNIKIPQDKELLKNLTNLFLATGGTQKAKIILEKAIKFYPNDKNFLKTYANVLLWTNDPYDAIGIYYKLFRLTHNDKYAVKTFKMAIAFHRFDVAYKLIPYVKGRVPKDDISYAYLGAGRINKLINFLKNQDDEKSLKELIYILYQKGDLHGVITYVDKLEKEFGIDVNLELLKANSYYYLKDFKKALHTLVKYKRLVPTNDKHYWKTLSSLAFYMRDYKDALYASLKNIKSGNGDDQDYDIASFILENTNPKMAVDISLEGWEKTHKKFLLLRFMYLALKTGNYKLALDYIDKLPKKELDHLYKDEDFDMLYSYLLYKDKDFRKFFAFSDFILSHRFNDNFLAQYIYLLYDIKNTKRIKQVIKEYKAYESRKDLRTPFALLYEYLQDGKKALSLIYPLRKEHPSLYSDVLYLYGYTQRSKHVRYKYFKSMNEKLSKNHKLIDNKEFLRRYLSLGYDFIPPNKFNELLSKAKKLLPKQNYENIYLSYLIGRGYYDKALKELKNLNNPKGWELLSFALHDYDTYFMYKLLEHKIEQLPTRDRVQALVKVGQIRKAIVYAYKGLDQNPMDRELYKQFRDLSWQYENSIHLKSQYYYSTPINYFNSSVRGKNIIGNSFYLKYSFNDITPIHLNKSYYLYAPNFTDYNLSLEKLFDRGFVDLSIGAFKGIKDNPYALFDVSYKLYNLTLNENAYYDRPSYNETSYLLFGGMERGFTSRLNIRLDNSQSFDMLGSYKTFYSQDKFYIGGGEEYNVDYFKQFKEDYPDIALRVYSYGGSYSKSSNDYKSLLQYLYPNAAYVPSSFITSGINLLIGYKKRYEYSHFWYPYLSLDSNYTNNNTIGYGISGGIGGPMLGQDKLIFFIDYEKINGGFKENVFNVGLSYKRIY
ncbi:tetratricopeptide repeat protein [Hydrogenobaculum acidophilum]